MVIYNISISGTRKQKGIKHDNMSSAIPHYHKQINLAVIYIDTLIKNARKSYIPFEIYLSEYDIFTYMLKLLLKWVICNKIVIPHK